MACFSLRIQCQDRCFGVVDILRQGRDPAWTPMAKQGARDSDPLDREWHNLLTTNNAPH